MGREGLFRQPPWREQGGEAVGPLLQDEDPRSMAEQTRNLRSRAPQPLAKEPPAATPWGGLPSLPSPALMGKREPAPAPAAPGGTQPLAPQEGEAARPGEGAERWLREPDQKFHLEAARRQGLGSSLRRQREGKGGLVHAGSRDGSQFEFLPKDGQQFT